MKRCKWVGEKDYMIKYHDEEWGVPVFDDKKLFEYLILDGAQAGLSWDTILRKRSGYKKAFSNWNYKKVAKYTEHDVQKLLKNPDIVRNQLKIRSTIKNAQHFMEIQKEFGSFKTYLWNFVNNKPIKNKFKSIKQIPASTELSDKISKDLKKRGFSFVGTTIIYAFIQAAGLVNDHEISCFRYNLTTKQ